MVVEDRGLLPQQGDALVERERRATRSPVAPYARRVPTFWVSKGAPRLGWCWAGNPHSWLGAASAAGRLAPVRPAH